jgi:hemerythrin
MMQNHFGDEERLMRASSAQRENHAIFEAHKEAHANMAEKMAKALGAASTKQQRAEILDLITHWLTEHIDTHDKVLIDWITGSIE